jgi:DNA-binding LytR/AlgR family response regulator
MIADDERPARLFLRAVLQSFSEVEIVGEAENGIEAVEIIKRTKPDLALLDLQMPEASGLEVVKRLRKNQMPLVAFVTAYDEFAVQAFEVNAVDYLLKPIEKNRLCETLERVSERLEQKDFRNDETKKIKNAVKVYDEMSKPAFIDRIPVKTREEIILVPLREIVSIVADGELLHITTLNNKRFVINFRLKDLEARIAPNKFIRLSRGALANLEMISKINPMIGGTYQILLKNGQELAVSRLQAKFFRDRFLKM